MNAILFTCWLSIFILNITMTVLLDVMAKNIIRKMCTDFVRKELKKESSIKMKYMLWMRWCVKCNEGESVITINHESPVEYLIFYVLNTWISKYVFIRPYAITFWNFNVAANWQQSNTTNTLQWIFIAFCSKKNGKCGC